MTINTNARHLAVGSRAMAKGMSPQNVGHRFPAKHVGQPAHAYSPFHSKLATKKSAVAMRRNPLCATPRHKANASAPPVWVELWDPSNQANYYHNQQTGITQWEPPADGYVTSGAITPR